MHPSNSKVERFRTHERPRSGTDTAPCIGNIYLLTEALAFPFFFVLLRLLLNIVSVGNLGAISSLSFPVLEFSPWVHSQDLVPVLRCSPARFSRSACCVFVLRLVLCFFVWAQNIWCLWIVVRDWKATRASFTIHEIWLRAQMMSSSRHSNDNV